MDLNQVFEAIDVDIFYKNLNNDDLDKIEKCLLECYSQSTNESDKFTILNRLLMVKPEIPLNFIRMAKLYIKNKSFVVAKFNLDIAQLLMNNKKGVNADIDELYYHYISLYKDLRSFTKLKEKYKEFLKSTKGRTNYMIEILMCEFYSVMCNKSNIIKHICLMQKCIAKLPTNEIDLFFDFYLRATDFCSAVGFSDKCMTLFCEVIPMKAFTNLIYKTIFLDFMFECCYHSSYYINSLGIKIPTLNEVIPMQVDPQAYYPTNNSDIKNIAIIGNCVTRDVCTFFILPFLSSTKHNIYIFNMEDCDKEFLKLLNLSDRQMNQLYFIKAMNEEDITNVIKQKQIDICIMLQVFCSYNCSVTMSKKPCKYNIQWIGDPICGCEFDWIDYKITDKYVDSEQRSEQQLTCEKSNKHLYLDGCFLSYINMLGINYEITEQKSPKIGVFSRVNKINQHILDVIKQIIDITEEDISFLVKSEGMESKIENTIFSQMRKKYSKNITLAKTTSIQEHLDIMCNCTAIIDTYPYSSTTICCEALSLGILILSYYENENDRHSSKVCSDILHNCGLDELICHSVDEMAQKANDVCVKGMTIEYRKYIQEKFMNSNIVKYQDKMRQLDNILSSLV